MRREPLFLLCAAIVTTAACTPREDCVPRCLAWVPIYDPIPLAEGEFIALVARDPTTNSIYVNGSNSYRVPRQGVDDFRVPEEGLDLSMWRLFHEPWVEVAPGLERRRDPYDTMDLWRSYGVTLTDHATQWVPLRKLTKDDYPEVVLADMTWQGSESFPHWAQQFQESISMSYLTGYGTTHPPDPAIEYIFCRFYTGDPSIDDTAGKGACNHPDLPNEANGWEGTSWAEMP